MRRFSRAIRPACVACAACTALSTGCGTVLGLDGINYETMDGGAGGTVADATLPDVGGEAGPGNAVDAGKDAPVAAGDAAVPPDGPFTLMQGLGSPRALAVDDTQLYFINVQGSGTGSVQSVLKSGEGSVATIATAQPSPLDLVIDGANLYWSVNQTPPAGTASQCLTMLATVDGGPPACAVSGPAGAMRMAAWGSYVAVLSEALAAGVMNQYIGIGTSTGGYESELTQGPSLAVAVNAQSVILGNGNGNHIDQVALPAFENFGPTVCTSCGGGVIADMVFDVTGTFPLWVNQVGGVFAMSVPPIAAGTGTHLAELPAGETPQRIARDSSYVYVTTTTSVFAVPILPIDAGLASLTIATGEVQPFGVAVDADYVYWTDGSGRIRAASVPPPP